MRNSDVIKARCRQRLVERGRDVGGTHRGTEPPCHDVAREVVEHGREIVPAPTGDLEVGEVGLPELVDGGGLVLELVRRLDHYKSSINTGLPARTSALRSSGSDPKFVLWD